MIQEHLEKMEMMIQEHLENVEKKEKQLHEQLLKQLHEQLLLEELILWHDVHQIPDDPYPDDNSGVCWRKHRKPQQDKSSVDIPSQLRRERRLKEKRISRQRYFDMDSKYNSM